MNDSKILGYQPGNSFIHALNATTKMIFLILVSIACMVTYDTRFLIAICILSLSGSKFLLLLNSLLFLPLLISSLFLFFSQLMVRHSTIQKRF